jgi:2-dehydro-3-deoxygluconokinase
MGETMVAFVPRGDGRDFRRTYVGAESNVAIGMANAGARCCWVSRVGDDEAGEFIVSSVRSHGVTPLVEVDGERLTGMCVKELREGATTMRYYRTGSAASQLTLAPLPDLADVAVLHVTGITPALSSTAATAVRDAIDRARDAGTMVSFDLNLRRNLWPDIPTAREQLLSLVRRVDVVFVGADESRALDAGDDAWTFAERAQVPEDSTLVFKHGEKGAEVWHHYGEGPVYEPAEPGVEVVDVTGAGDAFAAGFLVATLHGAPSRARLRLGHLMAARAVTVTGDVGEPLTPEEIERVLGETSRPRLRDS